MRFQFIARSEAGYPKKWAWEIGRYSARGCGQQVPHHKVFGLDGEVSAFDHGAKK
jgi:hypothetical protein